MKKMNLICLFAILAALFIAGTALAHPPSDLLLSYNRADGLLSVDALHSVGNGKSHYIEEFTLSVDGEIYYKLDANLQIDNKSSVAIFQVGDLKPGSVIEVKADCNRPGSLTKTLVVE